jgi:hypothetical protein
MHRQTSSEAMCSAVCRGWCEALAPGRLWSCLDLSPAGGVARNRVTLKLATGATARARGELEVLDVSGVARDVGCDDDIMQLMTDIQGLFTALMDRTNLSEEILKHVARAHGVSLRVIRYHEELPLRDIEEVLRCAPNLHLLEVHAISKNCDLWRALSRQPPFEPLRVLSLLFPALHNQPHGEAMQLLAALKVQTHMRRIHVCGNISGAPEAVDALFNAALVVRLEDLKLDRGSSFCAANVPALEQLLVGGALQSLCIDVFNADGKLTADDAARLGAALRASSTLTSLTLRGLDLWHDPAASTALLGALAGHPTLRELNISSNEAADSAAAATLGAAIGALLSADAPSLERLDVSLCGLDDSAADFLVAGMAACTHLRDIHLDQNDFSDAVVRDRLEPAMKAMPAFHRSFTPWVDPATCELIMPKLNIVFQ